MVRTQGRVLLEKPRVEVRVLHGGLANAFEELHVSSFIKSSPFSVSIFVFVFVFVFPLFFDCMLPHHGRC